MTAPAFKPLWRVSLAVLLGAVPCPAQKADQNPRSETEKSSDTAFAESEIRTCLLSFEAKEKRSDGTRTLRGKWWYADRALAADYTETLPDGKTIRKVGVWTGEKGYYLEERAEAVRPWAEISPRPPSSVLLAALPALPLFFDQRPFLRFLRDDATRLLERGDEDEAGRRTLLVQNGLIYRFRVTEGQLFPDRTTLYTRLPGRRALPGFPEPECITHPVTRELWEPWRKIEVHQTAKIDGFTLPTRFTIFYPMNTFVDRCDIKIFVEESSVNTVVREDLLDLTIFPPGSDVHDRFSGRRFIQRYDGKTKKAEKK